MNLLLLLAHSIEEYDQVRILTSIGHDVFSIGAYTDPRRPTDDKRPALPSAPWHPDLAALVEGDQMAHKAHLPSELIEWADAIIVHHFPEQWIVGQWARIRHKRVVWRTVGQSNPWIETLMRPYRSDGMQIVRYSPAERRAFEPLGAFAGQDALIRFGKYSDDWQGWTGKRAVVGNITQDMKRRGEFCGYPFWQMATEGLDVQPAGPGSEDMRGGIGPLDYDAMRDYLRNIRVYLYTGTQPASYTLGLVEAMMTGVPVVSIGPGSLQLPALFEGHELADSWSDDPELARTILAEHLAERDPAGGEWMRSRALALFDAHAIAAQWQEFLA
jgi:hypothetical protein